MSPQAACRTPPRRTVDGGSGSIAAAHAPAAATPATRVVHPVSKKRFRRATASAAAEIDGGVHLEATATGIDDKEVAVGGGDANDLRRPEGEAAGEVPGQAPGAAPVEAAMPLSGRELAEALTVVDGCIAELENAVTWTTEAHQAMETLNQAVMQTLRGQLEEVKQVRATLRRR